MIMSNKPLVECDDTVQQPISCYIYEKYTSNIEKID